MIYVTSDLHGYPLADFQRLLKKAGFGRRDELIVLGDVIDRNGDGGIETLLWMTQQINVRMILGNHEAMMLSCGFLFENITTENVEQNMTPERVDLLANWLSNGAQPTIDAWKALYRRDPEVAEELLEYLQDCPLYEILKMPQRNFVLTHSGLGNYKPRKPVSSYTMDELIWNRPAITDRYFAKSLTIFGHTPTVYYGEEYKGRMLQTDTWIDIDTGASFGGHPMLLRLEDLQPFYADD